MDGLQAKWPAKSLPRFDIPTVAAAFRSKGPSINYGVSKSAILDPLPPLCRLFIK